MLEMSVKPQSFYENARRMYEHQEVASFCCLSYASGNRVRPSPAKDTCRGHGFDRCHDYLSTNFHLRQRPEPA
jgi:hypothetical protein